MLAARLASSAANKQPVSYIVVKGEEKVGKVFENTRWAAFLPPELGQPKDNQRPTLFIAVVQNAEISTDCDTDAGLPLQI